MAKAVIYHNPRCKKSRDTLKILEDKGLEIEIVEYLKNPPSQKRLKEILKMAGLRAADIVRKGEAEYKDNYKGKDMSEAQWVKALVEHPKMIERPLVVVGSRAALGRPPESVLEIL